MAGPANEQMVRAPAITHQGILRADGCCPYLNNIPLSITRVTIYYHRNNKQTRFVGGSTLLPAMSLLGSAVVDRCLEWV